MKKIFKSLCSKWINKLTSINDDNPKCWKWLVFLEQAKRSHSIFVTLRWRHNERDGVSNHQPNDCLFSRLFRRRSKKTSKLRVTGLCAGNSPETGEFPAQRASNAENVSIWWRHHEEKNKCLQKYEMAYVSIFSKANQNSRKFRIRSF